jgi:hypothetical protein
MNTKLKLGRATALAALVCLLTGSPGLADDNVAMVYLIGPDRIQVMASDIVSTKVGTLRNVGATEGRSALRVCFNDAIHERILQTVRKDLNLYDHFKIVIGCTVAEDLRITSFEGLGNCNFFASDNPDQSYMLEANIRQGMTKSSCADYVS